MLALRWHSWMVNGLEKQVGDFCPGVVVVVGGGGALPLLQEDAVKDTSRNDVEVLQNLIKPDIQEPQMCAGHSTGRVRTPPPPPARAAASRPTQSTCLEWGLSAPAWKAILVNYCNMSHSAMHVHARTHTWYEGAST